MNPSFLIAIAEQFSQTILNFRLLATLRRCKRNAELTLRSIPLKCGSKDDLSYTSPRFSLKISLTWFCSSKSPLCWIIMLNLNLGKSLDIWLYSSLLWITTCNHWSGGEQSHSLFRKQEYRKSHWNGVHKLIISHSVTLLTMFPLKLKWMFLWIICV